jgi:hypothetical protein
MSTARRLSNEELRDLYKQDGNDFSEQADRDAVRMLIHEVLWRRVVALANERALSAVIMPRVDLNHIDALPPEAT